jgi:hypothetical protein
MQTDSWGSDEAANIKWARMLQEAGVHSNSGGIGERLTRRAQRGGAATK